MKEIKKYKGKELCEATIGVDPNSKQPKLLRCKNSAEYIYYIKNIGHLLCDNCLKRIKEKHENSEGNC